MWLKSFSVTTNKASIEQIWEVLTNINQWNTWDNDIEWIKLDGEAKLGADFLLKPKGGPETKLTISTFNKPNNFSDIAHLPFAKMETIHNLSNTSEGVKIEVIIKVTGFLSFLWSRVIAQKQIDGGVQQTNLLIEKAKTL